MMMEFHHWPVHCESVTRAGLLSLPLSHIISKHHLVVTTLSLTENKINDMAVAYFAQIWSDFGGCRHVTPVTSWLQLSKAFPCTKTNLCQSNTINDIVLRSLAGSFTGKSCLEKLNISKSLLHASLDLCLKGNVRTSVTRRLLIVH